MKKIIGLFILSVTLMQAKNFFGMDLGYIMYGSATSGGLNSTIYNTNYKNRFDINGITVSANYGVEGFLNSVLGGRIFGEILYSNGLNNGNKNIDLNANADAIINIIDNFGFFGGFGAGYEYAFTKAFKNAIDYFLIYGRTGLTFALDQGRIDLTFKLPMVGWNFDTELLFVNAPFSIQLGYKHFF